MSTLLADADMQRGLDLVHEILGHRLQQTDIKRILNQLSASDRDSFTDKLADILRKTAALLEVARRVSDSLSLDVLLPRMVELVSEMLAAERCTIFLYDREKKELYSRVAMGDGVGEIRFPAHLGLAGAAFMANAAEIIPDCYADARFNQEFDKKTGYRTRNMICAPVRNARGEAIGVTQVLNRHQGDFSDEDVRLLDAINSQAASAFSNAQLHEQLERQRQEESKLLEVTTAISRELHLMPLLQRIMETVTVILDADRSTLFMYDAKTKELWSNVGQGLGSTQIRFPAHLGIAGSVFTTRATVNIPDAYADPRFNPAFDKKTGYKTNTILCMPVLNKQGEAIGVTQVINKRNGLFTATDEQRLRAFSAQAAIAIENAQLFEDVINVKNYNESILQSMSNGVLTFGADGLVQKANNAALRIFRLETSPEVLHAKTAEQLFHGKNAWLAETVKTVVATGKTDTSVDQDLWLRQDDDLAADERRRDKASVNINVVQLKDAKGEPMGCMMVLEDITKEKRLKGTMSRYMNKALADRLAEEGEESLGGKLVKATCLFTDIRSFTSISERIGPQETVSMLNEYFSLMVDVLMGNGGILDKYIGDAIMAVFGAPFPGERDADNAVATGVGMLRALRELNGKRRGQGQDPLEMGIGINTDEVLSGNIGSLKRMDFTVIGDGVNLASRLEGANKPYGTQLLISEFTKRALHAKYLLREVDLIRVKGKSAPVAIFEVMDHYDLEQLPHLGELLSTYHAGLEHYRRKEWHQARHIFSEVLLMHPADTVARLYKERCFHFIEHPPDDDWDGVWTMKSK